MKPGRLKVGQLIKYYPPRFHGAGFIGLVEHAVRHVPEPKTRGFKERPWTELNVFIIEVTGEYWKKGETALLTFADANIRHMKLV